MTENSGAPAVQPLWSIEDAAGAAAMPFADGDLAVFTALNSPRVVALDAATGQLRWSKGLPGGPAGLGMPASSIVAFDDAIVVGGWNLFSFARGSGALRWSYSSPDEYVAASPITLAGDLIISPGSVSRLFAVDARTGQLTWQLMLSERPFGPLASNGVVYVGTRGYARDGVTLAAGRALAVRASDGAILWSAPLPNHPNGNWLGGAGGTGALTADAYIIASPSALVYAFDRATGAQKWSFEGPGPFVSGVGVVGDVAVVASLTGDIFGLDTRTGTIRWRMSTGGSSVLDQITSNDRCALVPVVALMCISQLGGLLWEIGGASRGGPLFLTPAFTRQDRVYIGSLSGYHALQLRP